MKVISIILGVFLIIEGISCILTPVSTYLTLAWIIGVAMVIYSVSALCSYSERKRLGLADGWSFANAIVSLIFGVVLLFSYSMQLVVDVFMLYFASLWLILAGVFRIISTARLHKMNLAPYWVWSIILGIIMILSGVISLFFPGAMLISMGINLGIMIIISGIDMISLATIG